jgi:hypothetical protein
VYFNIFNARVSLGIFKNIFSCFRVILFVIFQHMNGLTVCLNDAVTRVKITKLPKPVLEKLDRLAREEGCSRSSLIRNLLIQKLEEQDDGGVTG